MPTFRFNKLIRDKLEEEYVRLHHAATYKRLSERELLEALKQKIIEEAKEIPVDGPRNEIIGELADVEQVLEDIAKRLSISNEEIRNAKQKKFEKKGGFSKGLFVEKVSVPDDDEWVEYYRKSPEKYEEL
jgi:predicted house-cleaning noncanonical NTP pyrophosphatase (MazG superfamily)